MGTRVLTAARPLGTVGPRATVPWAPGGPGAAGRQGRDEQRALRPCPPLRCCTVGTGPVCQRRLPERTPWSGGKIAWKKESHGVGQQ